MVPTSNTVLRFIDTVFCMVESRLPLTDSTTRHQSHCIWRRDTNSHKEIRNLLLNCLKEQHQEGTWAFGQDNVRE